MEFFLNPKNNDRLSRLGFGCMRLPMDKEQADRLIRHAIACGINYFDTAYIYPGNEALLGSILKDGLREKVKLATKLPHYRVKRLEDLDRYFNTELSRLQTDHIDYYLIHMLNSPAEWQRMLSLGAADWIKAKKDSGQIRQLGFSFHGAQEAFIDIVDMYGWDFCMIQYNYLDENHQAGKKGLVYAAGQGLPVFIMEPLRGGKLAAKLPREAMDAFHAVDPAKPPARFALEWLYNHPEIAVVLSGMTTTEMIDENCDAARLLPEKMPDSAKAAVQKARDAIAAAMAVPCTNCAYCMPCPKGVDIPMCFSFYNDASAGSFLPAEINYIMRADGHYASRCVACGLCEKHCPQAIPIREQLKKTAKKMEGPLFKPLRYAIRTFLSRQK